MLEQIKRLYHFTDRRNLNSVKNSRGLYSLSKLREMGITIEAAGGNELSQNLDTSKGLDKYVHLCFRRNHPMEFRAKQEGRIEESAFLEIDRAVLEIAGVMFTDDVSNKTGVKLHPIREAADLIDFEILNPGIDFRDSAILKRLQRAEKYEILVPDFIPLDLIRNL